MSIKLKRYHFNESEFKQNGRTRGTCDLPANIGFSDLTSSQLVLDMHVDCKQAGADVLYPVSFSQGEDVGGAASLIRHSKVRSKTNGLLNERRHANVIDATMNHYTKSRSGADAMSAYNAGLAHYVGMDKKCFLPENPWLDYSRPIDHGAAGTVTQAAQPTVTHRAEILLPWKHIDNFASMSQFPNLSVGDLHYQIEFEDTIDVAYPAKMPFAAFNDCANVTAAGSLIGLAANPIVVNKGSSQWVSAPRVGQEVRVRYENATAGTAPALHTDFIAEVTVAAGTTSIVLEVGAPTANPADACQNVSIAIFDAGETTFSSDPPCVASGATLDAAAVIGSATVPIQIPNMYINNQSWTIARNPFYVGAPIRVSGRNTTQQEVFNADATISSIFLNNANDSIDIELVAPVAAGAGAVNGDAIDQLRVSYRNDALATGDLFTVEWTIDEAYLELHEIQLTPQQQDRALKALEGLSIPFIDQMLVMKNIGSATNLHTEVIEAPAMCSNLAVLAPQNNELKSGFDNVESYRFSIDGVNNTNRDIVTGQMRECSRPLHNHMLQKYFANLGMKLQKYDNNMGNDRSPERQHDGGFFPLVLPVKPIPQVVQLTLDAPTTNMTSKNLHFVWSLQRALKVERNQVMVM